MSLNKATYVVASLILMVIFPCPALAASFDCAKAKSRQERLICSTPSLSKADDIMAAKYTRARSAASKISSEEALDLKADQSGWILQKIQHCTPDITCLSKSYKDRIAFLDFYLQQGQSPIAIPGTYKNQSPTYRNNYGELQVRLLNDDKVVFSLWASTVQRPGTAYETVNDGEITDEAVLKNTIIKYDKKTETDETCKLQISFTATKAVVQQEGTCGFGLNVQDERDLYARAAASRLVIIGSVIKSEGKSERVP